MDIDVYTCSLPVKHVVHISYVAVRGKDEIEGAVQRVLNPRRIANIKDFILNGNRFFNTFILNWTEAKKSPSVTNNEINIPIISAAAQMIDGQHRLEGLRQAMEANAAIGEQEILVSVCSAASTSSLASDWGQPVFDSTKRGHAPDGLRILADRLPRFRTSFPYQPNYRDAILLPSQNAG